MEISGPAGTVAIHAAAHGRITAHSTSVDTSVAAEARWVLSDPPATLADTGTTIAEEGRLFTRNLGLAEHAESFDSVFDLILETRHLYAIEVRADTSAVSLAAGSLAVADAFIDPVFSLGPGVDSAVYTLNFSDGIRNEFATPVPVPAALYALLSALLVVGRRRSRCDAGSTQSI